MKLNLGCGGNYKKKFLNVDAFDSSIADKIMTATDLKLEDNSVEEIVASQLIEHLGIVGSIYSLSECFRVLKPGGKLIIETPDIRTSFEEYLEGGRETRKNILPWIYGVDMPGMLHRFCFPDDLLEEILRDIGFVDIEKKFFEFDEHQPTLRIVCKKTQEYQPFQIISNFRKKLLKKKLIDLNDQISTLEKEELIKIFVDKIDEFLNNQKKENLDEITIEGALHSPEITYVFLEEIINHKVCSRKILDTHFKILKNLIELRFSDILVNNLEQLPGFVGRQEVLFSTSHDFGRKTVKNLLMYSKEKRKAAIDELSKMSKNISSNERIGFFSEKLVMLRANRLFQKGVKEFNLSNYEIATRYFKDSMGLYRDQILTYWNLGRLYVLQNDIKRGISNYKNALKLLRIISYKNETDIRTAIEKEVKDRSLESIKEPLLSLYNI